MKNKQNMITKMVIDNFQNSSIEEIQKFIGYHIEIVKELNKLLFKKYEEKIKGEEIPF